MAAKGGRAPRPTALKELEGKDYQRPCKRNPNEPKPSSRAPNCPSWLLPDAKKEWRRLAKELESLGLLSQVDLAAFAGYCQSYARWKEAEEFIYANGPTFETPNGYIQQIPQVSIAQQNLKQLRAFCVELGLTPSARTRITVAEGSGKPGDAMEELVFTKPSLVKPKKKEAAI